ncbi:hypothetical protein, partial [Candidatus Cardinium sp. cBcalN2]|uniref:hypothetical protein n=1 Tax=Candidatus Cardinium sp. cBcalN2 TaxID=2699436 RepID=UPI001FB3C294
PSVKSFGKQPLQLEKQNSPASRTSNRLFFYFSCKGCLLIETILQGAFLLFLRSFATALNGYLFYQEKSKLKTSYLPLT